MTNVLSKLPFPSSPPPPSASCAIPVSPIKQPQAVHRVMMHAHNKRRAEADNHHLRLPLSSTSWPTDKKQRTRTPPRIRSSSPTSVGRLSYPHKPPLNSFSIPTDAISTIISFASYAPKDTRRYASVSKSFNEASKHNIIWKPHCHCRWETKWGFNERWGRALEDYQNTSVATSLTTQADNGDIVSSCAELADNSKFWYERYLHEEKDSRRQSMREEEILHLRFDCRTWFGPHHLPTHLYKKMSKDIKYSGLRCSQGIVQFIKTPSGATYMTGHRRHTKKNAWFLEDTEKGCMLSFCTPFNGNIHPLFTYSVQRLDNWGWQMFSNYQIMRAVDIRLYSHNNAKRAIEGVDNDSDLWSDYVKAISFEERPQNTKAVRTPTDSSYTYREVPDLKEIRDFLVW